MPPAISDVTKELWKTAAGAGTRPDKARRAAAVVRVVGGYRWVGLYDVGRETISVLTRDPRPFSERDRELLGACAGAQAGLWDR